MPTIVTRGAASAQAFGAFASLGGGYWIATLTSTTEDPLNFSVAVDSNKNVYVVGTRNGNAGILAVKYNSSGVLQWQKYYNTGIGIGQGCAIDSGGNLLVAGYYNDGSGIVNSILKLNSSGSIVWQRTLNDANSGFGRGIGVDSSDNVYFFSQDGGMFSAKYNSSGTFQWQRLLSFSTGSETYQGTADSSGNNYLCGTFTDASSNLYFMTSKRDSSGNLTWQRRLGATTSTSYGRNVAVSSGGNVYVVGDSDVGGGTRYFVLVKYNSSGTIQWQRKLTGTNAAYGYGIALDSSENVYISGQTFISTDNQIAFAKYNSSGTIQWQRYLGSSLTEYGSSVCVDSSGDLYVASYNGASGSTSRGIILAKLPSDGSKTGTYTVGGRSFTYDTTSFTAATSSLTGTTTTGTSSTPSATDSTPTYSLSNGSYTAAVTSI